MQDSGYEKTLKSLTSTSHLIEHFKSVVEKCILPVDVKCAVYHWTVFSGKLLVLSQEKYASHVVEKALECGSTAALCSIMDEIFDGYQCDRRVVSMIFNFLQI